jgi:aspartyl-tRNA(Asn)/glutamyl-tRNA(Gln) amidotransferase subunit A
MTRTVGDAALMLNVLSRPDARDWWSLPYDARDYTHGLEDGVAGLRIAFSPTLGDVSVDPEVARLVEEAAQVFVELGAEVEDAQLPFDSTRELFRIHWHAGAASLLRDFTEEQRAHMDPGLREIAEDGRQIALLDYLKAGRERAALGRAMRLFHETYDLLLTPSLPITAFTAGQEMPDGHPGSRWFDWAPFSNPFNLSQQPAISVPCGLSEEGLPVGLQIVGPMHDDAIVLRAARAFERARPWHMPSEPHATAGP